MRKDVADYFSSKEAGARQTGRTQGASDVLGLKGGLEQILAQMSEFTTNYPVGTLVGAFAVGVISGWLIKRR